MIPFICFLTMAGILGVLAVDADKKAQEPASLLFGLAAGSCILFALYYGAVHLYSIGWQP